MKQKSNVTKSFWSRPEGRAGIIVIALLLMVLGAAGYFLGGILLAATGDVIALTIMLVIASAIGFAFLDPGFRTLMGYFFRSWMKSIASFFVTIDPLQVLKNYVLELEENLSKMKRQMNRLRVHIHRMKEQIQENQRFIGVHLEAAEKAKGGDNRTEVVLKSRKAGRLKESNQKLTQLLDKMQNLYDVLQRMSENSFVLKEDIKDQVAVKEKERQAIRVSHSAMESAMNMVKGDRDQRKQFDEGLEEIADEVSMKVGEMEHFMEISDSFLQSIDLQNGVYEEKGLRLMEDWQEKTNSGLLKGENDSFGLEGLGKKSRSEEKTMSEAKDSSHRKEE